METRLIIFIALLAVELLFNAVVIWLLYMTFSAMTSKITECVDQYESITGTRKWLATLQASSEQAVQVTNAAKEQFAEIDLALQRAQTAYSESLRKVDVRFSLVCRAAHFSAKFVHKAVTWPVRNVLSASAFVRGVVDFIRGSENGAGARTTRTR